MSLLKRIWNKLVDSIYTYSLPNVEKTCRVSHSIALGNKANLFLAHHSSIGPGAYIMNTRAKVYIGQHFVSGPRLTIITGDHMPIVGRFLNTVTDADKDALDKEHLFDQDVVIKEDVWTGYNVIILKGVTIGRGAILSAGAVVVKDIPPYCIAGGVPAKPIKMKWTVDEILEHEAKLYSEEERMSRDELEKIINQINK